MIWLRSQAPVIREVANTDFPSLDLGDPTGNGVFNPLFKNGLVQINAKGTFPLGNDFAGIDPDNSITLPDDWAFLASKFGVDDYAANGGRPGSGSMRWDIHDDNTTASNHAGAQQLHAARGHGRRSRQLLPGRDAGIAGGETGPFSHYFGYSSFDTSVRSTPSVTSTRCSRTTSWTPGTLRCRRFASTCGSPQAASGRSRRRTRTTSTSATAQAGQHAAQPLCPVLQGVHPGGRSVVTFSDRSGVAGAFVSNNFPGYQNSGVYDYYDLVGDWTEDPTRGDNTVICRDELGNPRPNIAGADHVAVYTDEHGEAFVAYNPNTGFRLTADSNGRCPLTPGTLGTASITAEALYPDQPVLWDQASKVSNTIVKTVNSLASKTLACVPKGPNEMFCVETIRDIQGRPVVGARSSSAGRRWATSSPTP